LALGNFEYEYFMLSLMAGRKKGRVRVEQGEEREGDKVLTCLRRKPWGTT